MTRSITLALLLAASPALAAGGRVAGSKHDFSVSGPGPYRAVSERSPCVFCHATHRAGGEHLNNRPDPAAGHAPYESSTMIGRAGVPGGASRICLSCHDGTIAVGQTRNGEIRMASGDSRIGPERAAHLGTDLRGSHPVSLRIAPNERVHEPHPGDAVRLDRDREVQCTSCHDPHDEWGDPTIGKFLVKPSERSALCLSCHTASETSFGATHMTSAAQYRDPATGSIRTIAQDGCNVCHVQHGADKRGRLLRTDASGDDLCLKCHSGATQKTISTDIQKPYAHQTSDRGQRHDPAEGPNAGGTHTLPERSAGAPRHVACVDCHDPHASNPSSAIGTVIGGALAGVSGIGIDGQPVSPARHEYEVCLKCHGDSANKPLAMGLGGGVRRAVTDDNLRLVFAPGAASSHPIAGPARNLLVPSLKAAAFSGSTIRCTDCHASDQGPGAGGTGVRGPHGSSFPALLERQYRTGDPTPEGPDAYALCYKCHDRDVVLSSRSTFPLHRRHVVEQAAPCSVCHDPHGISSQAGNERNNAHLISFDVSVVRSGSSGPARYDAAGVGHGTCSLTCHGALHAPSKKAFAY